ncbi:hypothetical protein [Pantoea sp. AS142]|uniref:hypothetical protein n=1 Tax=Pantoea sp. AS142 TaxID=3081292 RepID=UPI003019ED83
MMSPHQTFNALQQAGIDDQQAKAMVEVFTDMQQEWPSEPVGKQLASFISCTAKWISWMSLSAK